MNPNNRWALVPLATEDNQVPTSAWSGGGQHSSACSVSILITSVWKFKAGGVQVDVKTIWLSHLRKRENQSMSDIFICQSAKKKTPQSLNVKMNLICNLAFWKAQKKKSFICLTCWKCLSALTLPVGSAYSRNLSESKVITHCRLTGDILTSAGRLKCKCNTWELSSTGDTNWKDSQHMPLSLLGELMRPPQGHAFCGIFLKAELIMSPCQKNVKLAKNLCRTNQNECRK